MTFKYQEYIDNLSIQCPPSEYLPKELQAFRFVFDASDQHSKNNFLPVLIIKPSRQLNHTPAARCQGYALSLFDTKENAEKRYSQLIKKRSTLPKSLGTHLAKGFIDSTDGLASEVDENGHFSLHEFANVDLSQNFNIVAALSRG